MLRKKITTLIGITLLSFGAVVFAFSQYEKRVTIGEAALCGPGGCPNPNIFLVTYDTKMSLDSSQSIEVHTSLSNSIDCPVDSLENIQYDAELYAPGFDIEPSAVQHSLQQNLKQSSRNRIWIWVAKPINIGTYELVVKISAHAGNCEIGSDTQTLNVTVVTLFGLNALQSKIVGIIIAFLGSVLTLPGILEMWNNRKKSGMKSAAVTNRDAKIKLIVSAKGDEKEIDRKK